jgi:hypothetical protein
LKLTKSWLVRGRADAVTRVPAAYQCAEIIRIARGRYRAPKSRQASV